MEDLTNDDLEIAVSGLVLSIRLNRKNKRNALTYEMYDIITGLLRAAATDTGIRCVMFSAAGSIFTAGHDVSGFGRGLSLAYDEKPSFKFMQALSRFPKPVIAAVNGDAVGIGATMLLHCDLVYAVPDCRVLFPFVKMGLVPEFASTYWLPRLVGHRKAMALFLREGRCTAAQAVEWGIVNETVSADDLSRVVTRIAAELAELSPDAVVATKRLVKTTDSTAVAAAIAEEAKIFHELLGSTFVRDRLAAIAKTISTT